MSDFPLIAYDAKVMTTTLVNVRQGAPSISAPVCRKLAAGTAITVNAIAIGDSVQGNAHWYRTSDDLFVWAGGCGAPVQSQTLPDQGDDPADGVPPVVDLYHEDTVTSFAAAHAAGVLGIIHKATTGATGVDDFYPLRRPIAEGVGLLWGAYHWGTAADVSLQVRNFLNVAEPGPNTLVALDFETTVGNQMSLDQAREFLQQIEAKLGRKAVLYGGALLKDTLGSTKDAYLASHRLWLAQYGPIASVQASWSDYWLWQYSDGSDKGLCAVPGITGNAYGYVDRNRGSPAADLAAQWAS